MGSSILEFIRRYSGLLNVQQTEILRQVLAGDIGDVPPGVSPPDPPGVHPPDPREIFDDTDLPQDVAPAGATGVDNWAARRDHKHRGVHSLAKLGDTPLFGDVTLSTGGLLTLTQTAQNLHLDLDVSSLLAHRAVERYQLLSVSPMVFNLLYDPVGEVAVYFDGFRKHQHLHYDQTGRQIALSTDVTPIDGDLLLFDYFYSTPYGSDAVATNPNILDFSVTDQSGLWVLF